MKKYAVIDVGTNNVLLLIAKKQNDSFQIIDRKSEISALGKNFKNKQLTEAALNRVKRILTDFIEFSKFLTNDIFVVGTSVSREAKNIYVLKNWLKRKYNLDYDIISGEMEGYFNGIANIRDFPNQDSIILFDVGGGSTEFTLIKNKKVKSVKSIDLGIRRLDNLFGANFFQKLGYTQNILNKKITSLKKETGLLVGIGGTVTSLSAIKQKLREYKFEKVHKSMLSYEDIKSIFCQFNKLDKKEIKKKMPFQPARADIMLIGTMIIKEIVSFFAKDKIWISDKGMQFGYLDYKDKPDLYPGVHFEN